ncbi:MAG: hypothetical protein Q9M36_01665 [Sulfurovum sp.]|nr:hypothetical protein [Sulfurovum sp.]
MISIFLICLTAFGAEDNISIESTVEASDGYMLYYETKTAIEPINKFSRINTWTNNELCPE